MKLSLFVLLTLNLSHAGVNEVLASVNNAFSKGVSTTTVLAISLTALTLVALAVFNEIRKSTQREKQRAQISWDAFNESSKAKGLTHGESQLLIQVLQKTKYGNAEQILESPQAFENAVEMYYKLNRGTKNIANTELDLIRSLRGKLGFFPLPVETPYLSTRQFSPSMSILVELLDKGSVVRSKVAFVDEHKWAVVNNFDRGIKVQKENRMRLIITRGGDAEYTMECEVFDVKDGEIIITHTRRLHRKQLRSWVRIDVSIPVVARLLSTPNNDKIENVALNGRITDLSGGGLAMILPQQFVLGSVVSVSFTMGSQNIQEFQSEVVRVATIGDAADSKYSHSISFTDERKEIQEKIVRYVFEKQRQDLYWK